MRWLNEAGRTRNGLLGGIGLLLITGAGCDGAYDSTCGNQEVIEFYEVVADRPCEDCGEEPITSHLPSHLPSHFTSRRTLSLSEQPVLEIGRCRVTQIYTYDDAVMLLLDRAEGTRVSTSDLHERYAPGELLAARIAGEVEVLSLLRVADLRRSLLLLDLDTQAEIKSLLRGLAPEAPAVIRTAASVGGGPGVPAASSDHGSSAQIARAGRHRPLIEELKRLAGEGKTETPEYEAILDQLEADD